MGMRNDSDATHIKWPKHRFAWVNKNSFEYLWWIFRHDGKPPMLSEYANTRPEATESTDAKLRARIDGEERKKNEWPTAASKKNWNKCVGSCVPISGYMLYTENMIIHFWLLACVEVDVVAPTHTHTQNERCTMGSCSHTRSSAEKWLRSAGVGLFVPRKKTCNKFLWEKKKFIPTPNEKYNPFFIQI